MKRLSSYRREQVRYTYAYAIAAALTLIAYSLVTGRMLEGRWLAGALLAAAAAQLFIQSRYFLHLDDDKEKPKWRLASYLFTWFTLLIIVIGSLWVMNNLNYNMTMTPEEMNKHMLEQNAKGF